MLAGKADPTQISAEGRSETRDELAKVAGVSHDAGESAPAPFPLRLTRLLSVTVSE